jgi:MEMO1 family protein
MLPASVRLPAVAGQFYTAQPDTLQGDVDSYLAPSDSKVEVFGAIACLVPHAGYMYSGHVAGAVYRRLPARPSYIVLGPNHFGRGAPLAVMEAGSWLTPLGQVPLNSALAQVIRRACPALVDDAKAHATEHSIEVQLPFLQCRGPAFTLLPIAIGLSDYETLETLGHAVSQGAQSSGEPVLIVASSDLNHYEPDNVTRVKDAKAIDRILDLDPEGLYETVLRERISMCGFGPAVAMLVAANDLGAGTAELVKYATSADAGGPVDSVVGYAGIVIIAD